MSGLGMACCPTDGEPLIATMRYRGAEFACMVCGRRLGFLEPSRKPESPALQARHDELRALFDSGVEPGQMPEPVDEVVCPNCGHRIRAQMSDRLPVATPTESATRARCDGLHPYNPRTGAACVDPPGHESAHRDARGNTWWDNENVSVPSEQGGQQ